MFKSLKRVYKRNSHNPLFGMLAGLGRAIYRAYENRNHDVKSNGELAVIRKMSVNQPKVMFDVGANIGDYAKLWLEMNPDLSVHCFEPVKDTFNKLCNNLDLTKNNKSVHFVNKALSSQNGTETINVYPDDQHASIHQLNGSSYQTESIEEIELVTGDDYLTQAGTKQIDFLKIDVEGHEMDVLKGFQNTLRQQAIKVIQFEYGYINMTTKIFLKDYYDYLEPMGYVIGKIYPKSVDFRDYELKHEDFIGPNFIAVSNREQHLIKALS